MIRHKMIWITAATVIMMPLYVLAFSQGRDTWFSEPPTVFTYTYEGGENPLGQSVQFEDFDQDNFADAALLVAIGEWKYQFELHVLKGLGTGDFSLTQTIELPWESGWGWESELPWVVHTGDINGDEWADIIVKGEGITDGMGGSISSWFIYLNTGTGFRCAGDIDGDGVTRMPDLLDLLEDWGCDESAP